MRALITGASSGLGREFAIQLHNKGFSLILVARSEAALNRLKDELAGEVEVIALDLSTPAACFRLHQAVKGTSIDLLINNAGFGLFGPFTRTNLQTELNMIQLNVEAVHILTKLFLNDFVKADKGIILNISSLAAFLPGPLMAAYYASKAYVQRLSEAIYEELRQNKSNVQISLLCPGPVKTNFNQRAGAGKSDSGLSARKVVQYTLKKMAKRKLLIIPGFGTRLLQRVFPLLGTKFLLKLTYLTQKIRRGAI